MFEFKDIYDKEAKLYKYEQFFVFIPAIVLIVFGFEEWLIGFALLGVVIDFLTSEDKLIWLLISAITISLRVAAYFGVAYFLHMQNLDVPGGAEFGFVTVAYGLILTSMVFNFYVNAGIVTNHADMLREEHVRGEEQ